MAKCCQEFQSALDKGKIIQSSEKFYAIEHNVADDGDGHIDEWNEADLEFEIRFCPFCGKKV